MLFFLLFIVLMPALTYADYRLYGKKMEETLAAHCLDASVRFRSCHRVIL